MFNLFKPRVFTIYPYLKELNGWLLYHFDDVATGTTVEPFEMGITAMIAQICEAYGVNPREPFTLKFSSRRFDGNVVELTRGERESGGRWYYCKPLRLSGWLCPVLFRYFNRAPKHIYVSVSPMIGG